MPQIKNFQVVTEKKSIGKRAKTREFFQNLEEHEASIKSCFICTAVVIVVLLMLIGTILYAILT